MDEPNSELAKLNTHLLLETAHIPIAQLTPLLTAPSSRSLKAIVTLTWPYSSATKMVAFLLAEPDFRLRRTRGQVRVQFSGSSAKAIVKNGIASGDEVILGLDGVEFIQDEGVNATPGRGVEFELKFTERLLLQFRREDSTENTSIDIDHPEPEPEPQPLTTLNTTLQTPVEPEPTPSPAFTGSSPSSGVLQIGDEWSSPAFLKRARTSYGSMFDSDYDIFAEADGTIPDKGRKRTRLSTTWRYSSRSPSPEIARHDVEVNDVVTPEPALKSAPLMADEESQTVGLEGHGMEEKLASPTFGQNVVNGAAPLPKVSGTKPVEIGMAPESSTEQKDEPGFPNSEVGLGTQGAGHGSQWSEAQSRHFPFPVSIASVTSNGADVLPQNTVATEHQSSIQAPPLQPANSNIVDNKKEMDLYGASPPHYPAQPPIPAASRPQQPIFGQSTLQLSSSYTFMAPADQYRVWQSEAAAREQSSLSQSPDRLTTDDIRRQAELAHDSQEQMEHLATNVARTLEQRSHCPNLEGELPDGNRKYPDPEKVHTGELRSSMSPIQQMATEAADRHFEEESARARSRSRSAVDLMDEEERDAGGDGELEDQEHGGADEEFVEDENAPHISRDEQDLRLQAPSWHHVLGPGREVANEVSEQSQDGEEYDEEGYDEEEIGAEEYEEEEIGVEEYEEEDIGEDRHYPWNPSGLSPYRREDYEDDEGSDVGYEDDEFKEGYEDEEDEEDYEENIENEQSQPGPRPEPEVIDLLSSDEEDNVEMPAQPQEQHPETQINGDSGDGESETNEGMEAVTEPPRSLLAALSASRDAPEESGASSEPVEDEGEGQELTVEDVTEEYVVEESMTYEVDGQEAASASRTTTISRSQPYLEEVEPQVQRNMEIGDAEEQEKVSVPGDSPDRATMPQDNSLEESSAGRHFTGSVMNLDGATDEPNGVYYPILPDLEEHLNPAINPARDQTLRDKAIPTERRYQENGQLPTPIDSQASKNLFSPEVSFSAGSQEPAGSAHSMTEDMQKPSDGIIVLKDSHQEAKIRVETLELTQDTEKITVEEKNIEMEQIVMKASHEREPTDIEHTEQPLENRIVEKSPEVETVATNEGPVEEFVEHEAPKEELASEDIVEESAGEKLPVVELPVVELPITKEPVVEDYVEEEYEVEKQLEEEISHAEQVEHEKGLTTDAQPSVHFESAVEARTIRPGLREPVDIVEVPESNRGEPQTKDTIVVTSPRRTRKGTRFAQAADAKEALRPTTSTKASSVEPYALRSRRSPSLILDVQETPKGHDASAELATAALESPTKYDLRRAPIADLKIRLLRTLRTDLSEFTTLKVIRYHLNQKLDALVLATSTPPEPQRAKNGPRQCMINFNITDQSIAPSHVVEARIFRPYKDALPIIKAGDGILLRDFQVFSVKGKGFGLRSDQNEASSWAVFKNDSNEVEIRGPPVEYGDGEKSYIADLKEWYASLDATATAKLARANEKGT